MKRSHAYGVRHCLAVFLLVGLGAGCGKPTGQVSGKVTYRGKPLTSGVVILFGEDGRPEVASTIGPDGTYAIAKAPVGSIKTGVDTPAPLGAPGGGFINGPPQDPEVRAARAKAAKFVGVPAKYKDPGQSGLSFEIKSGVNTIDINLP